MPIKIFEDDDTRHLESEVNKFIEGKKVLHIQLSTTQTGEMMKSIIHRILVQYE